MEYWYGYYGMTALGVAVVILAIGEYGSSARDETATVLAIVMTFFLAAPLLIFVAVLGVPVAMTYLVMKPFHTLLTIRAAKVLLEAKKFAKELQAAGEKKNGTD